MVSVFGAFARALRDLAHPRVLAILLLPMLGAIFTWSALAWFFWDAWIEGFRNLVESTAAARWLATQGMAWILDSTAVLLVIVLLAPAILITAMLITELVAMPVVVSVVARAYPSLEKRKGGTILGSAGNALFSIVIFALLWIVTLPLWLTGIGALVIPALTSAYLNQRLFRYDALSEHASREEYRAIVKRNRGRLYALGLVLAGLYYVPFVNLIAPVVTGLAFTHFCLGELARIRSGAV
jgi:CysZ protein